jgi:multiple sugar transport system substrate-binding protein
MRRFSLSRFGAVAALALSVSVSQAAAQSDDWSLEKAAEGLSGTSIKATFLDRPGYQAAIDLIPRFEEQTGIDVSWEILPYENTRERQVLDFTAGGEFDVVLVDVVWIGEYARNGWIVPMQRFFENDKLANPNLDLDDFFPVLLNSFGTWDGTIYGLPFDNYSGLLFYNKCMLEDAGFDGPPETWMELKNEYGPKLTNADQGQYAFALQSRRGETQSADSFMRMIWPFGGSLLKDNFRSNLLSEESLRGLRFRQELMDYMPPGIVDYDHAEVVNALAQENVAMITEWSAFYPTLNDPESSNITDCLGVSVEPKGPAGRSPALGGFSLAVAEHSSTAKQKAAYLFIQWVTSKRMAEPYLEHGGVPGRQSVYEDAELREQYPYIEPMVKSWQVANPTFRPRFPQWPAISEIIAEHGTKMMLGDVGVKEGARVISEEMEAVLKDAGYYSGDTKKLK